MAFVTVNGLAVEVRTDGARERPRRYLGGTSSAHAGNLRSTRRGAKRAWDFTTRPMTAAEVAALEAAIGLGVNVPCGGDALPAGGVVAIVTVGEGVYVEDAPGFQKSYALAIEAV